jgi:hypothetical protein
MTAWSDKMRDVMAAGESRREWTTTELANVVGVSMRQVRDHLHTLVDEAHDTADYDGASCVWRDR